MHAERCNGPAGWRQSGSCVPLECCFDPDWRVAAYAQAATRPCTDVSWCAQVPVCHRNLMNLHPAVALAFTGRCLSTLPVAR